MGASQRSREARLAARRVRTDAGIALDDLRPAEEVLEASVLQAGLYIEALGPADLLLSGSDGVLDRDAEAIWYRADLEAPRRRTLLGHELGHWYLHRSIPSFRERSGRDGAAWDAGLWIRSEVLGYSPAQRAEAEANAFGAELLLPGPALKKAIGDGASLLDVVERSGLPRGVVARQLIAGFFVDLDAPLEEGAVAGVSLDAAQAEAVRAELRLVRVVGGPGTGKTTALIERVAWLAGRGVPPEAILVLTFSRNAADLVYGRLRQRLGDAASRVQIYTCHALALDLVKRYGRFLGLPPSPRVITLRAALQYLEEDLAGLGLKELLCMEAPAQPLVAILRCIAEWKACGRTPEELAAADAPASFREAVHVFQRYEELLRNNRWLDFEDLLATATALVARHDAVREDLATVLDHILVDDAQDLSRASLEFLEAVAAVGVRVWTAGDPAQDIYRFRGAGKWVNADATVGRAKGAELKLGQCHRCSAAVARAVQNFAQAAGLLLDAGFASEVAEGDPGQLALAVAEDAEAQAEGLARRIRELVKSGIPLARQVVLCRTNEQAARLAEDLEQHGIPTATARSMLAHSSVARALDYLRRLGSDRQSEDGRGNGRLSEHLLSYWFGEGRQAFRDSETAYSRMACGWLYRFIVEQEDDWDRYGVLDFRERLHRLEAELRRVAALREDRAVTPLSRGDTDACLVTTLHSAKGMEFDAVFLPSLVGHYYPLRTGASTIEEPAWLTSDTEEDDENPDARLLLVAMSRARRCLTVSTYRTNRGRGVERSPFWSLIEQAMLSAGAIREEWSSTGPGRRVWAPAKQPPSSPGRAVFNVSEIEEYLDCPRRHFLARESRGNVAGGYRLYADVLRTALEAARHVWPDQRRALATAIDVWEDAWHGRGGPLQPYGRLYDHMARLVLQTMVSNACIMGNGGMDLELEEDGSRLVVRADSVYEDEAGRLHVEHYRFRYAPAKHRPQLREYLLSRAARLQWPDRQTVVGVRYVLSDVVTVPAITPRGEAGAVTRCMGALDDMMTGLAPARTSPWCAACTFMLSCPMFAGSD